MTIPDIFNSADISKYKHWQKNNNLILQGQTSTVQNTFALPGSI